MTNDESPPDWSEFGNADPDGVVLLWSTVLPTRPEYVFTCQSQVLTAQFHPFDRHLLIGGSYCGEILLWDTRSKAAPVHRTPLSASGHTHPIFSLVVVGTKNSHSLVTASTDGRICVWNLTNLSVPTVRLAAWSLRYWVKSHPRPFWNYVQAFLKP